MLLLTGQLISDARASAGFQTGEPAVVMDSTKRDFGDVFSGEELTHTFHVRNAGTKALELVQKSTLSGVSATPRFRVVAARWSSASRFITPSAAGRPAAPS